MEEKSSTRKALETVGYVISCLILAALLAIAIGVLVKTVGLETASRGRFFMHKYLAFGFAAFFLVFLVPRLRQNFTWLMKFTHELTHLFFAILFFRKIYRFKVDESDSYVSYSNGWFGYHAITLSPYCVPLFTLALLPWRFTTASASPVFLAVIDAFIGFTYAFHICCWIKQIRLSQTDISGPGTVKSLLCICLGQIINLCLVLLTPGSGVQKALERVFWDFPSEVVTTLLG